MRTIVDLPKEQISALARLCKRKGISRAEAVRQAVAEMLKKEETPPNFDEFFGMWKDRNDVGDGLEYQRKLRAEWEER